MTKYDWSREAEIRETNPSFLLTAAITPTVPVALREACLQGDDGTRGCQQGPRFRIH